MAEQIPEAWIGQEVTVYYEDGVQGPEGQEVGQPLRQVQGFRPRRGGV
jgi:hypothetical protein